jgi:hypothetical protein
MLEVELLAAERGQLEVRGNVVDLRKSGVVPLLTELQNAGFIHHMQLDLTIDAADARVTSVRIDQPYVAIEASRGTGGECCRDPAERLNGLEGERLVPGFEKHVTRLFGGPLGCSHLMTLGQTVGRALPRAIEAEGLARAADGAAREVGERIFKRTVFADGLAPADGSAIELVVQQCDLTTAPRVRVGKPFERFARQHEVQARALVAMDGLRIESLACEERARELEDVGSDVWTRWIPHDDEIEPLVGERIMPGLGSRLIARFGGREERRVLLDALLHLGPGFLQCIAALGDGGLIGPSRDAPAVDAIGGNRDSCFMWRSNGALDQRRQRGFDAGDDGDADRAGAEDGQP